MNKRRIWRWREENVADIEGRSGSERKERRIWRRREDSVAKREG